MFIYSLTMVTNFYSAIDLLRSKFMYLSWFYFPLTKSEHDIFKAYRFINIVLLENVPQLAIQIMYYI